MIGSDERAPLPDREAIAPIVSPRFMIRPRRRIQRLAVAISAIALLGCLLTSRRLWLADLENHIQIGNDRLTRQIDIGQPQTITWKIAGDDWDYTGEVHIGLVLDEVNGLPRDAYSKDSMKLKLKVNAYAITYEPAANGRRIDGFRADRLIRNWYFKTDRPLSPGARLWESGNGERHEFGLCGLQRYPWEDTYVVVEVEEADPNLQQARPRLEVTGKYDYAVYEHIATLRTIRDFVLTLLGLCVVGLSYAAIRKT